MLGNSIILKGLKYINFDRKERLVIFWIVNCRQIVILTIIYRTITAAFRLYFLPWMDHLKKVKSEYKPENKLGNLALNVAINYL